MQNWSFKQFLNSESQAWVEDYYSGLASALKKYDVDSDILETVNRFGSQNTKYILIETKGIVLGGIRIEIKSIDNPLPLEKSKLSNNDKLIDRVNELTQNGHLTIAELCGLWTNSEAKERVGGIKGLGQILCDQAYKVSRELGVDSMIAILPRHSLQFLLNLNFTVDPDLKDITYPDDRYLSTVVWMKKQEKTISTLTRDI